MATAIVWSAVIHALKWNSYQKVHLALFEKKSFECESENCFLFSGPWRLTLSALERVSLTREALTESSIKQKTFSATEKPEFLISYKNSEPCSHKLLIFLVFYAEKKFHLKCKLCNEIGRTASVLLCHCGACEADGWKAQPNVVKLVVKKKSLIRNLIVKEEEVAEGEEKICVEVESDSRRNSPPTSPPPPSPLDWARARSLNVIKCVAWW